MSNSDAIDERVLQTLVPVNVLTADHLQALLRDQAIETVCKGQALFEHGDCDNNNIYLLSGQVTLTGWDDSGNATSTVMAADDPLARFPLAHYQPRRVTAVADSDCCVIRFNSEQLDSMLAWDQASQYITLDISSQRELDEDADWMLMLLRSNLFYKVPPMNIRQILNKFTSSYRPAGETILRQGEMGDCCYFIKEGAVGVYQSPDEKSTPELVADLGVGRCFGEDALVNDAPRNATIVMHSNGVLMALEKQDFFLLLKPVGVTSVGLSEAKQLIDQGTQWVDVRTQDEFDFGHCAGALHMPLNIIKLKSRMMDQNKHYIVYCNTGRRSSAAAHLLAEDGFNVCMLAGGFSDYSPLEQAFFERSVTPDEF